MTDHITTFATEADMVAAFVEWNQAMRSPWTLYHETAGWDVLAVDPETGVQVGIEAKLSLNAKVLTQALPTQSWWQGNGPDYRAVLVPEKTCQNHFRQICAPLGLTVLALSGQHDSWRAGMRWSVAGVYTWPDQASNYENAWHPWMPAERCVLPDYVPDVTGGHAAPVQLTPWKVKAIKLLILLDRTGVVTRQDMKALQISPTRFCDPWHGFLAADKAAGGYVRCSRTPDLRAQHPVNFAEIEADFDKWLPAVRPPIAA